MDCELNNIINKDPELAQNEIYENNEKKLSSTKSNKSKKGKYFKSINLEKFFIQYHNTK